MTQEDLNMEDAQVGRILHFVNDRGLCRPAIVVNDWPTSGRPGYVNLQILTDGANDGDWGKAGMVWETSVLPNHATRVIRTWHWPRLCSRQKLPAKPFIGKDRKEHPHNHEEGVFDVHNCYACKLSTIHEDSISE